MSLRLDGVNTVISAANWAALIITIPITLVTFTLLGLYRAVIRFIANGALKLVLIGVSFSSLTILLASQALNLEVPRTVPGIYFAFLLLVIMGSRLLVRSLYLASHPAHRSPVLIYGVGDTEAQLLQVLKQSRNYRAAAFVNNDDKMSGLEIGGVPVIEATEVPRFVELSGIKTSLLVTSNPIAERHRKAAKMMSDLGLEVRLIPNTSDLLSGRLRISQLPTVSIDELLGRDPVPAAQELMSKTTAGRSVIITGAGGSIGSELCRQVLDQKPSRLVLFESSEYALYSIHQELIDRHSARDDTCKIIPILGSVTNIDLISRTIEENDTDTFFHAAAYKHVPLVETNIIEGVNNNVFGTEIVADAAGKLGVKNFVLISTDKAVRPTNIMGTTKRLAELVVKVKTKKYPGTKYCAVRFGNVLGSSGSVVPRFEKQIAMGGPITLTHPDVTRYFMTLREAAQLVVQASSMANRGEVFLLDMGEPVKILDLAKTMARLHGRSTYLEPNEPKNVNDIAIRITGLRPGEKLYEELLVDGSELTTIHPRIKCDASTCIGTEDIEVWLKRIKACTEAEEIVQLLHELPLGYSRQIY